MTEIGGTLAWTFNLKILGVVHPDSVLKIVNPDSGQLCGPNETGEILAKSSCYMKSYLNRPEETANFFAADGFVHTGDLAHYDANGWLYFDGRLKELIKYKNYHLYPLEIEEIIAAHPEVLEVAVFGKPDPTVQEFVTAAVVKVTGSSLTQEEIIDLVAKVIEF